MSIRSVFCCPMKLTVSGRRNQASIPVRRVDWLFVSLGSVSMATMWIACALAPHAAPVIAVGTVTVSTSLALAIREWSPHTRVPPVPVDKKGTAAVWVLCIGLLASGTAIALNALDSPLKTAATALALSAALTVSGFVRVGLVAERLLVSLLGSIVVTVALLFAGLKVASIDEGAEWVFTAAAGSIVVVPTLIRLGWEATGSRLSMGPEQP